MTRQIVFMPNRASNRMGLGFRGRGQKTVPFHLAQGKRQGQLVSIRAFGPTQPALGVDVASVPEGCIEARGVTESLVSIRPFRPTQPTTISHLDIIIEFCILIFNLTLVSIRASGPTQPALGVHVG